MHSWERRRQTLHCVSIRLVFGLQSLTRPEVFSLFSCGGRWKLESSLKFSLEPVELCLLADLVPLPEDAASGCLALVEAIRAFQK